MKSEFEFFPKGNETKSPKTDTEIQTETIEVLKDTIKTSRENTNLANELRLEIDRQDNELAKGKQNLVKMNKPLKKAEDSMDSIECKWCTIS